MTDARAAHVTMPVVIATASSAGGISALITVLGALPADLRAAVLAVQHVDRGRRSYLPDILERRIALRVKAAAARDRIEEGVAYVAPPNEHLLLNEDASLALTHTELVHFVRPSADLLFESVAAAAGPRGIAVVLTGSGKDGAIGTRAMHERGGHVIVQDEATSDYFGMPGSAIAEGFVDEILPLDEIASAIMACVEGGLA
jgi:two-component system chemotaxis response regulator CheB